MCVVSCSLLHYCYRPVLKFAKNKIYNLLEIKDKSQLCLRKKSNETNQILRIFKSIPILFVFYLNWLCRPQKAHLALNNLSLKHLS